MKEAFEKILERLEERSYEILLDGAIMASSNKVVELPEAIKIVKEVAEEYGTDINVGSNDGWILTSERLPEKRDWYLAVFKEPDTGFIGLPYIADYLFGFHTKATTDDGWIIKDCTDVENTSEYYKHLECVAWQPLPAPFKKKGD